MKKIFSIFVLVAAAAMALVSCNKQEVEAPKPQEVEYEYTFEIAGDTKATIGEDCVVWELGDQIGVYTDGQNGVSYNRYGNITLGSPVTFKVSSYYALVVGDMVHCYYPYVKTNSQDPRTVNLSIPTSQTEKNQMPMVSLPYAVTENLAEKTDSEKSAGEIRFANLGSVIEFHVYSTTEAYQTELVKSVTFNADQEIAGDFTFDMTEVDYSNEETLAIVGYEATSVVSTLSTSTQVSADKDAATVVKMVVAPGSYTGNIVVTTDKATYTYPISTAKEFKRSAVQPLGVNLRENVREENTSSEPVELTATLTFDDAAKRIVSTTTQQVWAENDITLTYNQADYNNNLAEYENPVRFYANTTISLEAPGNIESIEFACNTTAYATALKNAISGSSVNGKIVTVTLDGSSSTVTYKMTAQVRMDALTVKYAKADPSAPSITAGNVTDVSARGVEAAELTYEIANLEYSDLTVTCDGTVVTSASKGEGGVINYVVSVNSTTSAREGVITITAGTLTKEVKVSQKAPVFTVSKTEVVLEADAEANLSVTVTSDFDWIAEASDNAGFTFTPDEYVWEEKGKQSVKISAKAANDSEEGTITLGIITLTNLETNEMLTITVKQESSYVAAGSVTESISFASTTQRVSQDNNSQVWKNGGVTFTNEKASSSTAVGNYSNPVRLYQGSNVKISATGKITEVVIESDGTAKYKTALQNSLNGAGYTYTNSGNNYTITLTSPAEAVEFSLTAQARFKSLKVTYQN